MIEDDFYATIKLLSGEEIFAKVSASDEDDRTLLLISDPVIVEEVKLCLLYTSPSPRDATLSRMPSSA